MVPDAHVTTRPGKTGRFFRRWQFSLRTMLLVVTLLALFLGAYLRRVNDQRDAVRAVLAAEGSVFYDFQCDESGGVLKTALEPRWPWLAEWLEVDWRASVTRVEVPDTKLTDALLKRVGRLPHLRHARLGETFITGVSDDGLRYLRGLNELTTLYVGGYRVTDAGLRHLEGLSQLEELHLEGANITIAGVRRVERALPETAIYHGLPTDHRTP